MAVKMLTLRVGLLSFVASDENGGKAGLEYKGEPLELLSCEDVAAIEEWADEVMNGWLPPAEDGPAEDGA